MNSMVDPTRTVPVNMDDAWRSSPRNRPAIFMFVLTHAVALTLLPWYGLSHGLSHAAWMWFAVFLAATELAITCGYHRLFAHLTYQARPALRLVFLLVGAMALQNSALLWCAGHRVHHQYIDDPERDPYCARRGFWFSHIGWMLRNYPSGIADLDVVRDLQRDPLVMWQHRHYLAIALAMNLGVVLLAGWASGDLIGTLLVAGFLRIVVSHHLTFLINSAAHMFGTQPYTAENTARDNAILAVLTFGEGYHNFHHQFAHDYRNGVRWWQWDPSKWLIRTMSWCGLAYNLKSVPWFRIQRALLLAQFRRAERELAAYSGRERLAQLKARVAEEYAAFQAAVASWSLMRAQMLQKTHDSALSRWERSAFRAGARELERSLQQQLRRMQLLRSELQAG
jgi:stearoyl-CoA desaturase (delta-9 desaturase)